MPGARYNQLVARATPNLGYVTTEDAHTLSIPIGTLNAMSRRGQLDRVSHGVYRVPLIPPGRLDPYKLATLWPDRRGLISHSSALELHGMRELNPGRIYVTVPTAYRTHRAVPDPYVLRHEEIDPADQDSFEGVPIVSLAHAIRQAQVEELGWAVSPGQGLELL